MIDIIMKTIIETMKRVTSDNPMRLAINLNMEILSLAISIENP